MGFSHSGLHQVLSDLTKSRQDRFVAEAHNHLFEERVSEERWKIYEEMFTPSLTPKEWRARHAEYLFNRVFVQPGHEPETFLPLNNDAACTIDINESHFIRLEFLDKIFIRWNSSDESMGKRYSILSLKEDLEIIQSNQGDNSYTKEQHENARNFIKDFCDKFNLSRFQRRPCFAAYAGDLKDDLDCSDWAHRLCLRMGLIPHLSNPNDPIPVALMKYPITLTQKKEATGKENYDLVVRVPTVLDGEIRAQFFPSPKVTKAGYAMDLSSESNSGNMVREILHPWIPYTPEHLSKVGLLTPSFVSTLNTAPLKPIRNRHLQRLREISGNIDFGMEMS